MKKPVLVIMAAGMGSRYGGLKQIDPIDKEGHIIMDFSIYDAKRAGFEKVVFIIKKENETDFKEAVGKPVSYTHLDVYKRQIRGRWIKSVCRFIQKEYFRTVKDRSCQNETLSLSFGKFSRHFFSVFVQSDPF